MMNHSLSRRTFLGASAALPFGGALLNAAETQTAESKAVSKPTPLIHCTDLFHPHGDPDDHFDLASVFSLGYQGLVDLRGIGLDYPPARRVGDPDVMAVAQLNRACGMTVPNVVGTSQFMTRRTDTLPDLPPWETASIRWIIDTLEKSDRPVAITIVGGSTDVAIAALREPELFRQKCAGVYLNAGATHPHKSNPNHLEMNVSINPAAYAAMFDLPCPLYWFPCWHTCEERISNEWGTFYWMPHRDVFEGVESTPLLGYFWYMFSRMVSPLWLRTTLVPPPEAEWNKILEGRRGMWSVASVFLLAGLTVTKTGKIVPTAEAGDDALFRMEHVKVECEDNGRLKWELSKEPTGRQVFHVLDVPSYPSAMTQAVRSLLLAFPKTV